MVKQPVVSIIVPFRNAKKYIKRCIENILNQTYKKIEIILIDDGSDDDYEEIINKFKDTRIKLIKQEKHGVSYARNIGIKNATGKYIAFMDVDDELEINYIEKFVTTIEENKVDIVLCNYKEIYGNKYSKKIFLPWQNEKIYKNTIINNLIPQMISSEGNEQTIRGLVWRTFTTKDFILKNNISFIENINIAEDLLFTIQLYNRAESIYIIKDCLYKYNKNNNSTVNKYIKNNIYNQIYFHTKFVEILKKEDLYNKNLKRYNNNKMKMYTSAISNVARNDDFKQERKEIKIIREELKKEQFTLKDLNCNIGEKITYILLKINILEFLLILYKIKEFFRRKKLR